MIRIVRTSTLARLRREVHSLLDRIAEQHQEIRKETTATEKARERADSASREVEYLQAKLRKAEAEILCLVAESVERERLAQEAVTAANARARQAMVEAQQEQAAKQRVEESLLADLVRFDTTAGEHDEKWLEPLALRFLQELFSRAPEDIKAEPEVRFLMRLFRAPNGRSDVPEGVA